MEVTGIDSSVSATQEITSSVTKVLGKDDFLRLLTVQLQNQDPLTPMENSELVAQLAQFSSLEQLENINANLQNNLDLNLLLTQVLNNTAAAGLIGKQVVASGDQVVLGETGSADMAFDLAGDSASVRITIKDEAGDVVKTIDAGSMDTGRNWVTWDGTDEAGHQVLQGDYTFSVEALDADGNTVTSTSLVIGEVAGVRYEDGQALLLIGETEVSIGNIIEIAGKPTI
jgi:flagellar basal-body rod modification protein FlgD